LLEAMTAENWEVTRAKLLAVVKAVVGVKSA
jgi:hypothetical protein